MEKWPLLEGVHTWRSGLSGRAMRLVRGSMGVVLRYGGSMYSAPMAKRCGPSRASFSAHFTWAR